jgi:hypothetical protein
MQHRMHCIYQYQKYMQHRMRQNFKSKSVYITEWAALSITKVYNATHFQRQKCTQHTLKSIFNSRSVYSIKWNVFSLRRNACVECLCMMKWSLFERKWSWPSLRHYKIQKDRRKKDKRQSQQLVSTTRMKPGTIQIWMSLSSSPSKNIILLILVKVCRSQWPPGLMHEPSSLARTLGSWVPIQFKAWMSVCVYSVFAFSCM